MASDVENIAGFSAEIQEGAIHFTLYDPISVEELVDAYEGYLAQVELALGTASIWNLCGVDITKRPLREIRKLSILRRAMSRRGEGFKAALVTDRNADFLLFRVYVSILKLIGDIEFRVFRRMGDARSWVANG